MIYLAHDVQIYRHIDIAMITDQEAGAPFSLASRLLSKYRATIMTAAPATSMIHNAASSLSHGTRSSNVQPLRKTKIDEKSKMTSSRIVFVVRFMGLDTLIFVNGWI